MASTTVDRTNSAESNEQSENERTIVRAKDMDPSAKSSLLVSMPAGLKALIEEASERVNKSATRYVVELLAEDFEYTLPPAATRGPRNKYASPEERKEAMKKKRDFSNALLNAAMSGQLAPEILDALKASGITLPD